MGNIIDYRKDYEEIKLCTERIIFGVWAGKATHIREFLQTAQIRNSIFHTKDRDLCRVRSIEVLSMVKMAANMAGLDYRESYKIFEKYSLSILNCKTIDEMYEQLINAIEELSYRVGQFNPYVSSTYNKLVNECIIIITDTLPKRVTLQTLSEKTHSSDKYLSNLFHRETGKTITEFSHEVLVNHAKYFLIFTDLSLVSISDMLFFSSQSHFNRIFKKYTNTTPKSFRENNTESNNTIFANDVIKIRDQFR